MSGIIGFHSREAIRVKVKKCEGLLPPEYRKFSVDPQITSFEVLQSLLARAFDIKGEFTISYLAKDEEGQETYLSLLSDWDLDAAFLSSSDPCLQLKVDLKPFEEGLEDWDVISPLDIPRAHVTGPVIDRAGLKGAILNHMEKTITLVQRALNIGETETTRPIKPPMTDAEFHNYLDSDGRLLKPKELRLSVYRGGVEPSLRRVVWKHLLNVYPVGMSGKDRIMYVKQKGAEYQGLRSVWQDMIGSGNVTEEIQYVTNMVRKDVLRTDRTHKFYAGSDDNKNVVSLFNILTTYALNHPSVSYCQGMSDLASPILVTMRDEAHAYVCFCALMQRLKSNFSLDGKAMTAKFQHLTELLEYYDPQFFEYLKQQGADDMLFCYRWLLLELKREFAFEDALHMLEVLWSSIPPCPPDYELMIYEEKFTATTTRPQSPRFHSRENPYTKVRAIRKQNSASSIRGLIKTNSSTESPQETPMLVPPKEGDDSQEYLPMTTSMTRELRMELENLNRHLPGSSRLLQRSLTIDSEDLDSPRSQEGYDISKIDHPGRFQRQASIDQSLEEDCKSWTSDELSGGDQIWRTGKRPPKCLEYVQVNGGVDGNGLDPVHCCTPDEQCDLEYDEGKIQTEAPCNGEILENEESGCSCHLKSVIPIRLVHSPVTTDQYNCQGSDSSETSSENSQTRADGEDTFPPPSNNQSEGYCSESSKEVSVQEDGEKKQNGLIDSGVCQTVMTNSCEEALNYNSKSRVSHLPPPHELGCGNPFMLFLCLTLLLQHRDIIVRNCMDYNELAMHFDKMVRKHHVQRVLHQARAMFTEYLQAGWHDDSWETRSDPQV